jgi:hypothetical protein
VTGCLSLVAALAACGTNGGEAARPTPAMTSGGAEPSTGTPSGGGGGPTPAPSGTGGFVLTEGVERDVCGIGLVVRFIPPSARGTSQDQAFLVGGPVSDVHAVVPDPTGDQPLPSNIVPARAGTIVTLLGKRFKVDAVDVANRRVSLEALC